MASLRIGAAGAAAERQKAKGLLGRCRGLGFQRHTREVLTKFTPGAILGIIYRGYTGDHMGVIDIELAFCLTFHFLESK